MKKQLSLALAFLLAVALTACGSPTTEPTSDNLPSVSAAEGLDITPVIDIFAIADKTEAEVEAVLGPATISTTGTFTLKDGPSVDTSSSTYSDGTEITFIDDAAVRITIYPPDGSKVEDGAALIGLTAEQAGTSSYDSLEDYRWNNNSEYCSIDAFNNGDGTIHYIYVITNEKYE